MSNDYLWDRSGVPDPDIERLERLLGRLRAPLPPPPSLPAPTGAVGWRTTRFLTPMLAAAASIALMVGVTWLTTTPVPRSWEVARLAGQPRIASTIVTETGRLAVGQTLVTDSASRARLDVSTIGGVIVDGDTRVRLVDTRRAHHQLALERGTLHAFIIAPPRQFVVNTPSSTATDLGCVYSLTVDEDGTGLLSVTTGWVAFEYKGRESFVPAGAASRTYPEYGPGTPRYDDADAAFKNALEQFDEQRDPARRASALSFTLEHARQRDAMTLWHLLARVTAAERPAVVDALALRAPMPSGVARESVMRLERAALDLWWDSLGLRDANWWRMWKGRYPVER